MQDYMRALQHWFDSVPPKDMELKEEANQIFKNPCSDMDRPERNQLIQLVDIQDARREKTALQSFISGYKLAWGIHRELTDEPPYSFEDEQEGWTRRIFMENQRKEAQGGEAQSER